MTGYHPTKYIEANALLSMIVKDGDGVRDALTQMTPGELANLSLACSSLAGAIAHEYRRQSGEHIVHAPSWSGPNPFDEV